ncbi:MAG: hypothetical protein L6R41_007822 [Letrouitia leprolyta]|nr:MAG: hypothetical protein L6R41_007822 [Letrouitia leprolyta]
MQLRSGNETHCALAQNDEDVLMAELYPSPDPEVHRATAKDILLSVKGITTDMSLSNEQRLYHLHHMLELCALEHERETQVYQAAHRSLVEKERDYQMMIAVPRMPEDAFRVWEALIDKDMKENRSMMKLSRANARTLLNTIKHVEQIGERAMTLSNLVKFRKLIDERSDAEKIELFWCADGQAGN